jgi:3',5'-cyclic AMP phosphodiesterase CpdA
MRICCGLMGPLTKRPRFFALVLAAFLSAGAAAESTTLFVIADTGDCSDGARQVAAAIRRDPDATRGWLVEVGDLAYPKATRERLLECHEPHFGPAHFPRRLAVPGNHDARDDELAGFRSLFPESLPRRVDFGRWRALLLDSNQRGEAWDRQIVWAEQNLKESVGRCLFAAWHHPARSSGKHGDDAAMQPLWASLAGGASFTLHGHDHHYERLAARNASGQLSAEGTLSFVSGNGGAGLYPIDATPREGSVAVAGEWGYLKITLDDLDYRWQAVAVSGRLLDAGQARCRPVPTKVFRPG